MPVTIKVNGIANSLVHKGSNGVSVATLPDVCKTPSPGGPVPVPYPNISQSATLDKGTTTVKADGGMMIAVKGSEYSLSNGDNPGVAGGVKSNTFMKESTWILYSFDVKMDGKNACRLTDKKFQNHENTVDLAGDLQMPKKVGVPPPELEEIAKCCNKAIDCHTYDPAKEGDQDYAAKGCTSRGRHKHTCCEKTIKKRQTEGDWKNVAAEAPHPEIPGHPACRLDVQIRGGPGGTGEITHIWDFKFNCSKKPRMSAAQKRKYAARFPGRVIDIVGAGGMNAKWSKTAKAKHCEGATSADSC
jgi:hypothetical protein